MLKNKYNSNDVESIYQNIFTEREKEERIINDLTIKIKQMIHCNLLTF